MILSGVFTRRYRGFRVIDLLALTLVFVLALGSYVFTTLAGAQSADTAGVQGQIAQEQKRIRLLKAELAHLEDPGRIERLSTQYLGMTPVDPKREATPEALAQVASASVTPKAASSKAASPKAVSPAAASPKNASSTAASPTVIPPKVASTNTASGATKQ